MTAAELIAELQSVPPDTPVWCSSDGEGNRYMPMHELSEEDFIVSECEIVHEEEDGRARMARAVKVVMVWPSG